MNTEENKCSSGCIDGENDCKNDVSTGGLQREYTLPLNDMDVPRVAGLSRSHMYSELIPPIKVLENRNKGGAQKKIFRIRRSLKSTNDIENMLDVSIRSGSSFGSQYNGPVPLAPDGRPLKSCISAGNSPQETNMKRSISFTNINVREYERTVGDHPCVTSGPPLTLGWKYDEIAGLNLDEYEEGKIIRTREELQMPPRHRQSLLKEAMATENHHEIRKAVLEVQKTKADRSKTVAMLEIQTLEETAQAAKRKVTRFLKGVSKQEEQDQLWINAHEIALEKATKAAPKPSFIRLSLDEGAEQDQYDSGEDWGLG